MPTSKEPPKQSPKQPSKPRTSTRAKKAAASTSETEVPLVTAADGDGGATGSLAATSNGQPHADNLDERIRQRAYEIYLARGYSTGNELDDWLEAERQLRAGPSRSNGHASEIARA